MSRDRRGIAGRLAGSFIESKLTPLVIAASIAIGFGAVMLLPREEEPQIVVPMIDVFLEMPGASPKEIEQRVTAPMEKLLWEIPGVEYIYSTSSPGISMAVVRFKVGENEEDALVRLNKKLQANADRVPSGVIGPLVKPRSIDDVPVLAFTLSSDRYDHFALRRIAAELQTAIKQVANVSEVTIIGGTRRQLRVQIDPAKLAAYGIAPARIAMVLQQANSESSSGAFASGDREFLVKTGGFVRDVDDAKRIVVATTNARTIKLGDVATIVDGPQEPADYVFSGGRDSVRPAVTISVAKRRGSNATQLTRLVEKKIETLRGVIIPADVKVEVTRNYGETAADKSNELLFHMLLAVISVVILIGLALGWRESGVVAIAIPVTLALTLAVFQMFGYTLNRVTLFALIFSIGILVDDAIVVVENIVRHYRLPGNRDRSLREVTIDAVAEVGNPTILATFAVIAAILPMGFVRGLMGPYMRPIPVGAAAAMLFSLVIAFMVTPWAARRLLSRDGADHVAEGWSTRMYRRLMSRIIHETRWRRSFLGLVAVLLVAALSLFAFKVVRVKMLPFDNKSELQVIIDMPEGTTLERTAGVAREIGAVVSDVPEVANWQLYAGTASPYNFNGLVRHYFLRGGSNVADLQVNLLPKGERSAQSHDIAKRIRSRVDPVAKRAGARVKIAEVPPGPPVLQTLVAEIYGPDYSRQIEIAKQVQTIFDRTAGVVDVDTYVEDDQLQYRFTVDREKAALSGVAQSEIETSLRLALSGVKVGSLHDERESEEVAIRVEVPRALRSSVEALRSLQVSGSGGKLVSLGTLVAIEESTASKSIFHKNLMPVVYVTADVAGSEESPVYVILKLNRALEQLRLPEGYSMERLVSRQPLSTERFAMKWDGEWHITYEVFRDLGLAFAAVLILIYILIVGWFQSFRTPLTIMAAIPFSLIGIIPAHALMGAFFTATSMIGFIAGAGIVVRNSIILVDFIELRLRQGMPLDEAVIDAGAVRFRPMMLTAAAVVVGAGVMLFDPIFQGLAISLMAGEVASLLLSRLTVPVLYYVSAKRAGG